MTRPKGGRVLQRRVVAPQSEVRACVGPPLQARRLVNDIITVSVSARSNFSRCFWLLIAECWIFF
jgi:AMMECR1 domain-containing protein